MLFLGILLACGNDKEARDTSEETIQDTSVDTAEIDSGMEEDTAEPEPPYDYNPPAATLCDDSIETTHGFLCAIQPSRLDENARDIFDDGSLGDRSLGFGYHVVAFPDPDKEITGVYVHFTGSMGRGYNQLNGEFPSFSLLEEAMAAGYITIQLAYHNRYTVNSVQECVGSNDIDNCAGLVRREKITGEDLSTIVDVPISDSITHRMKTVVSYFDDNGFAFPVSIVEEDNVQWQNLFLGGHSQGAGHTLYITKYWGSTFACLFWGAL